MTRRYLNNTGMDLLEWPANSPDMNSIKNIWATVKKKVYENGSGKTRQDVIEKTLQIWAKDEELRAAAMNAVLSMPNIIC